MKHGAVSYDAVVFDLLTALLDSWTLWNDVAGSADKGMKWRRRYLEITYGCGAYRPYETLVRQAARDTGFPESFGAELERRWGELKPWPEAPAYPDYILFGSLMWPRTISTLELLDKDDVVYAWRERMLDLFDGMGRKAKTA